MKNTVWNREGRAALISPSAAHGSWGQQQNGNAAASAADTEQATLQMASPPFVQPAGVIPEPQWPAIRKQAEAGPLERRNLTSLSGSEQRF